MTDSAITAELSQQDSIRLGWFYHQEEDDYDRVFRNENRYQRFAKKKGAL